MTVGGGGGQSALCARPGVRGVGAPPGRGRAQCVYVRGGMMDLLWVGEPQGCGQCQELSIWGSWGCRQLCVSVCVCVRACGSALEPLCTHRNVAPLGSPSCPGSTWKWPPGKGKGGEERGGGKKKKKAPSQQSAEPKPSVRQRTVHPIPFPGRQGGRPGQARLPPTAAGASGVRPGGERRRGAPACAYGDGSIPLSPGLSRRGGRLETLGAHWGRGHGDGEPRRGALPNRAWLPSPGKGCQALPDLPTTTPSREEEKFSRERDRRGNRAELRRLARRGERCQSRRSPGCPASAGRVNSHPCPASCLPASRLPGAVPALSAGALPAPAGYRNQTNSPAAAPQRKGWVDRPWEIDLQLLCPGLSAKGRDLGEGRIS